MLLVTRNKRDIAEYVSQCLTCQKIKAPKQQSLGPLQPPSVLQWKWEDITIDFIVGLPKTKNGFTVIWVTSDQLTKSPHFIQGKTTYTVDKWAELYMEQIVQLHGILMLMCQIEMPVYISLLEES